MGHSVTDQSGGASNGHRIQKSHENFSFLPCGAKSYVFDGFWLLSVHFCPEYAKFMVSFNPKWPAECCSLPKFLVVTGHIWVRQMAKFSGVVTGHTLRRIDYLTTVVLTLIL
jgi:hypothetical protein